MSKQDSVRLEVLLALFSHKEHLTADQICVRVPRDKEDVEDAIIHLQEAYLIIGYARGMWGPSQAVIDILTIVGRGSAPLDRHVAEALAVREGRL